VTIDVTNIRLVCEFAVDEAAAAAAEGNQSGNDAAAAATAVTTPTVAVSLQPGERTTVRLRCTPERAVGLYSQAEFTSPLA
jgi:hypothetical protein